MCRVIQLYGIGYTVSRVHTRLPRVPIVSDSDTPAYTPAAELHRSYIEDCDQVVYSEMFVPQNGFVGCGCGTVRRGIGGFVWSGSAVDDLLGTTAGLTILHYSLGLGISI